MQYFASISGAIMEAWEYWTLLDHLTIVQAALMAANLNPSEWEHEIEGMRPDEQPNSYSPLRSLILNAVNRRYIAADIAESYDQEGMYEGTSVYNTRISRAVLIEYFAEKGIKSIYFKDNKEHEDQYNKNSPFYSPKLAAANEAWKAVTTEKHRLNKCTPKQALEKWLEENASRYGLLNSDGSFNKNGIEEVAKIANWKTKGGAPQLTAIYEEPEKEPSKANSQQTLNPFDDLDSEFPF